MYRKLTTTMLWIASHRLMWAMSGALLLAGSLVAGDNAEPHKRRPVTAVLVGKDGPLIVGNRCGSVSVISRDGQSVREFSLGREISDLCPVPGGSLVLASDFGGHELILMQPALDTVSVVNRIAVAKYPVDAAMSPTGQLCCVASLWSRRLTLIEVDFAAGPDSAFGAMRTIDLPCAPRRVVFLDDTTVLVTDAFGGRLVVIDTVTGRIRSVRELAAHNIRDVALDGNGDVWLTHQILHPKGRTEREHIHWGILLENQLTALPVAALLDDDADLKQIARRTEVGEPGIGAGDPDAIAITSDRLLVTLAGTAELALIDRVGVRELRVTTGPRPVAVVVDETRRRAFVVNSLDDSITVVDLDSLRCLEPISLGPTPTTGPVERGEQAFFNADLSHHRWMSCHSCHTDNHTNNRLADTLGDGRYGNAKRVPSLLGAAWTVPWGWDGSKMLLDDQVRQSLHSTMHVENLDERTVTDIAAYLSTLDPPPSVSHAREELSSSLIAAGRQVFNQSGCVRCHQPGQFTTTGSFDVGLTDETGLNEFNPPSLLGVSQRDRLFHDGRAKSLDAVVHEFGHQLNATLSPQKIQQLLTFLRSL
jgi:cytochrome c peroxidase